MRKITKNRLQTYFIMRTIRSMPSLAINRLLIEDSLSAEHNVSNTFSMNSVSSKSMGSFRRYCYGTWYLSIVLQNPKGGELTERTFNVVSTPSFLPNSTLLSTLSCRRIDRSSAAYPLFSSCVFDCMRFSNQVSIDVLDTSCVDSWGLNPRRFSKIPAIC